MVTEEVAEIVGEVEETMELSEAIEDIAKAGASMSKANKENLSTIIELCNKMMGEVEDDTNKSENSDDMQKAFDVVSNDLQKAHDRIKELEAIPEAPKGVLLSISKSDDVETVSKQENEPLTAFEAMKKAHQNPSFTKL